MILNGHNLLVCLCMCDMIFLYVNNIKIATKCDPIFKTFRVPAPPKIAKTIIKNMTCEIEFLWNQFWTDTTKIIKFVYIEYLY